MYTRALERELDETGYAFTGLHVHGGSSFVLSETSQTSASHYLKRHTHAGQHNESSARERCDWPGPAHPSTSAHVSLPVAERGTAAGERRTAPEEWWGDTQADDTWDEQPSEETPGRAERYPS